MPDLKPSDIDQLHYSGLYPLLGWVLHYLPFVAMARVTYLHHYLPALYFAVLTAGFCVDWFTRSARRSVQWGVFAVLYVAVIGLFVLFRAVTFGMEGPSSRWRYLKWFESWRITD